MAHPWGADRLEQVRLGSETLTILCELTKCFKLCVAFQINYSAIVLKMKLSGLLLSGVFADPVERASRDFGIKYASCDNHFRSGKAWPLQDHVMKNLINRYLYLLFLTSQLQGRTFSKPCPAWLRYVKTTFGWFGLPDFQPETKLAFGFFLAGVCK